jgi:hypothetical protein
MQPFIWYTDVLSSMILTVPSVVPQEWFCGAPAQAVSNAAAIKVKVLFIVVKWFYQNLLSS